MKKITVYLFLFILLNLLCFGVAVSFAATYSGLTNCLFIQTGAEITVGANEQNAAVMFSTPNKTCWHGGQALYETQDWISNGQTHYNYTSPVNMILSKVNVGTCGTNPNTDFHRCDSGYGAVSYKAVWYESGQWKSGTAELCSYNSLNNIYQQGWVTEFTSRIVANEIHIRTPSMGYPDLSSGNCWVSPCADDDEDGLNNGSDPQPNTDNSGTQVRFLMESDGFMRIEFEGVGVMDYGTATPPITLNISPVWLSWSDFIDSWGDCTNQVDGTSNLQSLPSDTVQIKDGSYYESINDDWMNGFVGNDGNSTETDYLADINQNVFNTGNNLGIMNQQMTEQNKNLSDLLSSLTGEQDVDMTGVEGLLQEQIDTEAENRMSSGDLNSIYDGLVSEGADKFDDAVSDITSTITTETSSNPLPSNALDDAVTKLQGALPSESTCTPIDLSFQDKEIILSCDIADNIKSYMNWIVGVMTVFAVFTMLYTDLRPKE